MMIQRLHELQTEEAKSRFTPAKNLPQDSQDKTTQTSNTSTDQQDEGEEGERKERDGESSRPNSSSKPLSRLCSAQKNGAGAGCSSTRLLPDFVYQASSDPASRETEDRQGGRGGGGGKRRAVRENGKKAKQKLNFTSCRSEEEEVERHDTSSTSWSEMSSMVIGSDYRLEPLSPAMEQRLILQYLTPLGDYQEVNCLFMEPK